MWISIMATTYKTEATRRHSSTSIQKSSLNISPTRRRTQDKGDDKEHANTVHKRNHHSNRRLSFVGSVGFEQSRNQLSVTAAESRSSDSVIPSILKTTDDSRRLSSISGQPSSSFGNVLSATQSRSSSLFADDTSSEILKAEQASGTEDHELKEDLKKETYGLSLQKLVRALQLTSQVNPTSNRVQFPR